MMVGAVPRADGTDGKTRSERVQAGRPSYGTEFFAQGVAWMVTPTRRQTSCQYWSLKPNSNAGIGNGAERGDLNGAASEPATPIRRSAFT
jgi:hypothetical protein